MTPLRLAFLAPDVVEAALEGRLSADVDTMALLGTDAVAARWHEQRERLLV